jgi:hypothetical protein
LIALAQLGHDYLDSCNFLQCVRNCRLGALNGDRTALRLLQEAALKGPATPGAMRVDGAALLFESGAWLQEQGRFTVVGIFNFHSQDLEGVGFGSGELGIGKQ